MSRFPRPATIVHTADVHLDRVDGGREQSAFSAVVNLSIDVGADMLLIAGDLFDHSRVGSEILDWAGEELARADRPIVLLVGNHDALNERSVYHRFDRGRLGERLVFLDKLDGARVRVPGTDIVVWGRAMPEHTPSFRPVQDAPSRQPGLWNIIAAHGLVQGVSVGYSSPITREELSSLDADYVALGHVHNFTVVQQEPLTVYPGAPPYSHQGNPGCVLVRLADGRADAEWVPLAERMTRSVPVLAKNLV